MPTQSCTAIRIFQDPLHPGSTLVHALAAARAERDAARAAHAQTLTTLQELILERNSLRAQLFVAQRRLQRARRGFGGFLPWRG